MLAADKFKVHNLDIKDNNVRVTVTNMKFRSSAQAVGRIASNLQRFTADTVTSANISFLREGIIIGSYDVDLKQITTEQFKPESYKKVNNSITPIDVTKTDILNNQQRFSWGIGPYITHRLFNPDMPLSLETGLD